MRSAIPAHRVAEMADRAEALSKASGSGAFGPAEPADRRPGRGRLSSIDMLPEEAQEDVLWAVGELNRRDKTQGEILFELNDKLAAKGVDAISKSAFNRKSIKLAAMSRRLDEARHLFQGLAPQFTAEKVDQNTIALGEFIKLLILELTQEEGGRIGTKGAMELARAHLAVIQGQKLSSERRAKLEAAFKGEASAAIEKVAKARGVSKAVTDELRRELFGIAPETALETAETADGA